MEYDIDIMNMILLVIEEDLSGNKLDYILESYYR